MQIMSKVSFAHCFAVFNIACRFKSLVIFSEKQIFQDFVKHEFITLSCNVNVAR